MVFTEISYLSYFLLIFLTSMVIVPLNLKNNIDSFQLNLSNNIFFFVTTTFLSCSVVIVSINGIQQVLVTLTDSSPVR